ncbi:MAG: glutathione S-transferase family protein [Limnohabitans sp.]|nr:glutathione S-transferase family protein [Limnohabitans sp.]
MIDVYSWPTPNGHKIHIMLEECGMRVGKDWHVHPINIGKGEQFEPHFLVMSPNNRIPAMMDSNGPDGKPFHLFESGAILVYLSSKFGKFMPTSDSGKFEVLQWLMFQMGGVGPMLGQNHHFRIYAPEKIEYAINRYTNEAKRLYGVMDKQLSKNKYIAGDTFTIADMSIFPWLRNWQNQGIDWADFPHLKKWFDAIGERPAVQRGVEILADLRKPLQSDDKAKENLFGKTQFEKR